MSVRKAALLGLLAVTALTSALEARAIEADSPAIASESLPQWAPLELRGQAPYRWYFLKLYDGSLYLPASVEAADVFEDVPKRLELTYARQVPLDKILEAGDALFAKNTPPEIQARLQPSLEKINAAFVEPGKGDRYTLAYRPGIGTELLFNDALLTTIEGAEFARYYFRIWLGEFPVGEAFRDALLGLDS